MVLTVECRMLWFAVIDVLKTLSSNALVYSRSSVEM